MRVTERLLRQTSTGSAPWHIVESTDTHYRNFTVTQTILAAISARLAEPSTTPSTAGTHVPSPAEVLPQIGGGRSVLDAVDLSAALSRPEYEAQLSTWQARLSRLSQRARDHGVASVLVFEGWDAAGKGGVIRRLTHAMDARDYRVVAIGAPTEEEQAHHYLWRFWRHLPRAGVMLIFDRSWYGRVLVERVEGFASERQWQRAYEEINHFEEQLAERGIVLYKFWLHIDPDTQLRRFQARENTPYKKYKLTTEDYRNRDKWEAYVAAVHEMVARTSTEIAPWELVAANDKQWARVQVLHTVCRGLKKRLKSAE
jgi:polyphosphate:AMP phosphotransferase